MRPVDSFKFTQCLCIGYSYRDIEEDMRVLRLMMSLAMKVNH